MWMHSSGAMLKKHLDKNEYVSVREQVSLTRDRNVFLFCTVCCRDGEVLFGVLTGVRQQDWVVQLCCCAGGAVMCGQ